MKCLHLPSPRLLEIFTCHWMSRSLVSNARITVTSWQIMATVLDSLSSVKPGSKQQNFATANIFSLTRHKNKILKQICRIYSNFYVPSNLNLNHTHTQARTQARMRARTRRKSLYAGHCISLYHLVTRVNKMSSYVYTQGSVNHPNNSLIFCHCTAIVTFKLDWWKATDIYCWPLKIKPSVSKRDISCVERKGLITHSPYTLCILSNFE